MKGYVQVYTGEGKGKTTAALGLALRAAGAGLRVFFGQFLKSGRYSEIKALERFGERITVEQFGCGGFVKGNPSAEDLKAAQHGLQRVKTLLQSEFFDLMVLDEACVAVNSGLFTADALVDLIRLKPERTELVFTGRGAPADLVERADLVTEMKAIKHYFQTGIGAREGIER